jgi:ubiquinone biosynthesis protein
MLELYVNVSLDHVQFSAAIGELLQLIRRHGLRLPGTLMQFFKALIMCEGILEVLDPESSFADYLQPIITKLIYQAVAGPQLVENLRDSVAAAAQLSIELPRRFDRLLGEIERGNLRVWTRVEDIEPIIKRVEHVVARTNATLLAAACIVALAIMMQFYHPRGWEAWIGVVFWVAVAMAVTDYVRTLLSLRRK